MYDSDESLLPMPDPAKVRRGKDVNAEATRLKAVGVPIEEIAERFGWTDADGNPDTARVSGAIRTNLAGMYRFVNDETRMVELRSLDELEYRLWRLLEERHVVISQGRVVRDEHGEAVADRRFELETHDRIMKIKERRAKMLGLDAPLKTVTVTLDGIEAEILRLEQELALAELSEAPQSAPVLPAAPRVHSITSLE